MPIFLPMVASHKKIVGTLALAALVFSTAPAFATAAKDRRALDSAAKMPPLKPAVIDETLAIGGAEIEARKLRSRLTVEVGVNGTGPYRFVVDSGADTSVIGDRLADALKLPLGSPVLLNSITDSSRVDRVLVSSLQIGPTSFSDLELPRLEDRHLGAAGMIGLDALVEQRLMLDFERRKISVDDAKRPAPLLDGEIVVTARLKRGQLILTEVKANKLPLNAVVDTGSEITIGNLALRNRIVRRKGINLRKIEVIGVTGKPAMLEIADISELKLGSIVLQNVRIAFADVPPFAVFGLEQQPALLIGTDLMENFRRVSLDFHARKVRFQLRKCAAQGITVTSTFSASRIAALAKNSPACQR